MSGWPWPLNGVQSWFESLWNQITWAATSAVSIVSSWVWSAVYWVRDRISESIAWLSTVVSSGLSSLQSFVSSGWAWISSTVTSGFTSLHGFLSGGWAWISSTVASGLSSLQSVISSGWSWISSVVSSGLSSLRSYVSSGWSWLSSTVSAGFSSMWVSISAGFSNTINWISSSAANLFSSLSGLAGDILTGVAEALGEGLRTTVNWLWEGLQAVIHALIGAAIAAKDMIIGTLTSIGAGFIGGLTTALLPGSPDDETEKAAMGFSDAWLKKMDALVPKESKSLPELPALISAAGGVVGVHLLTNMGAQMAGIALDTPGLAFTRPFKEMARDLVWTLQMPATVGPILAAPIWPGIIIPLRYRMNALYPNMIPDSVDLIRFLVREVISTVVFDEMMSFHGYSPEISGWFWEAHWVLPSFGNLRDAMWRGIIKQDQFRSYVVLHDYKPEPRRTGWVSDQELMNALSYDLPGRIQARWMFEQGVISTAEHRELTTMRGIHPDWIVKVTEAEARAAIRAETEAIIRENMRAYIQGKGPESFMRDLMTVLDLAPKLVEFWDSRAKAARWRELWLDRVAALEYALLYDKVTEEIFRREMAALDVLSWIVDEKVETIHIRRMGIAA